MTLNSGVIPAICKECGSRMVWHMENQPFVGGEIIGTCSDCLNRINHDIIDEFQGYNGEVTGRKIFKKDGN